MTKTQSQTEAVRRLRELLVWFFIVVGVLLILASFFPFPMEIQTLIRGFGLSMTPAGIVTLILSRFASSITEMLIRETVEDTIKSRLVEDMQHLDSIVETGITNINRAVSKGVEQIEHDMRGFSPLFAAAARLGVANILLTRGLALDYFAWFLEEEIRRAEKGETAQVWVVATSMKGFMEATSDKFDGLRMIERMACSGCDIRIMMTDPKVANSRGRQEQRAEGEISKDVAENLTHLKRIGIKWQSIRFYPGFPTVFAIATTDWMLLNPYPYQSQAFRCFSLVVHRTPQRDADIYHQYMRYHFEEPWQNTTELSVEIWNKL